MGVPQFFSWLTNRHKSQLLIDQIAQNPEYFYLDFNCAIHPTVKDEKITTIDEMYKACCTYLELLMQKACPSKLVYIAIDGVAPMGKIKQQRYRRFKNIQDRREMDIIDRKHNKWKAQKFDFNMISPGTEFMNNLNKHIEAFIQDKWPNLQIVFSTSNSPGEGEHKIMDHIRKNTQPDSRIVIYGLDSDLIFLSLINSSAKSRLHLLRERKMVSADKIESDGNEDKDKDKFTYFDIGLFRKLIIQEMMGIKTNEIGSVNINNGTGVMVNSTDKHSELVGSIVSDFVSNLDDNQQSKYIIDYVALSFMLGNDFLPHIPSLIIRENAVTRLINHYITIQHKYPNTFLVSDDKRNFNFKFLIKLLELISDTENNDLNVSLQNSVERINGFKNTFRYRNSEPYERDKLTWEFIENTYNNILLLGKPGWKNRFYTYYIGQYVPELVDRVCLDYFTGMVWMLRYYTGDCPSWSWYYKHRAAPAISDLYKYLENFSETSSMNLVCFPIDKPITTIEQLLLILPPQSSSLLPSSYSRLMTHIDSPIISKYPINFDIDVQNHTHRWECYPILPAFDPSLVHKLVMSLGADLLV